ncbi:MAG: 1-acyl-sn-glycerol-3-phosphate acyltransferase [Deltaproteobacteria bacterium]|nr:1-acyl-sn-glycerol-3-phosphate acyltransferase [Deltaproteobacteria bacterium]MBW2418624.1 1-acyl-sn-glycerol-3-phosphate acyltransferase [Deltaproteobacteria bacterium]
MIDEAHLRRLQLWERPLGQRMVAALFLLPNYSLPPRTRVVLEGVENIPRDRSVIFALNHTDRYNYWPFQWGMWHRGDLPFTTTWVKGKYYENKYLGWFFDQCNNIPLPSRGYLILQDALALLGRKLADDEYRVLRDLVDGQVEQEAASAHSGDLRRLVGEGRRDFRPDAESYAEFMHRWNDRLMGLVERRTLEALFEKRNNLIVFPQGTRSLRLLPGKPGLAQFALRHEIPVVPVGSMGSEDAYPGASPWAGGATCRYRIGRALTADDAFADCRIHEPYTPFTRAAEAHGKCFDLAMERVTTAIDALLDDPYKMAGRAEDDSRPRADRLI